MIEYIVTAEIPNKDVAEEYVHWMHNDHIKKIMDRGAGKCQLIRIDSEKILVEAHYSFCNRKSYNNHEKELSQLSEESFNLFNPKGIKFTRKVGEIISEVISI